MHMPNMRIKLHRVLAKFIDELPPQNADCKIDIPAAAAIATTAGRKEFKTP